MGKKRKKIMNSIPLCIFWIVWKEHNRIAFREWYLTIQRILLSNRQKCLFLYHVYTLSLKRRCYICKKIKKTFLLEK